MASPALPALFLCFAAMVLLIFVSVSSPTWEKISFLNVNIGGRIIHFGVFGYTGTKARVGYFFDPTLLDFAGTRLNTEIIHNLTFVLVLYPIAAGLSGLAVLFGLCGAAYSRMGTIFMTLTTTLATLVTLVVWVISMALWGTARSRFRNEGLPAEFGNANWLGLGALVALILAFCAGAVGSCGRYRRRDY